MNNEAFTYLGIDIFLSNIPVSKIHWLLHQNEYWKPVEGWGGYYQVSSLGRVKSKDRTTVGKNGGIYRNKGRIFKNTRPSKGWYKTLELNFNNISLTQSTHRLVAIAFIPNPDNKPQVNHKNGIKYDSRLINLEWCTGSENMIHAVETELQPPTITNDLLPDFIKMFNDKVSHIEIAERFEIKDPSNVYRIAKKHNLPKRNLHRPIPDDVVREIRKIHANKRYGYPETAKLFNINHHDIVGSIVRGQSYKDVL